MKARTLGRSEVHNCVKKHCLSSEVYKPGSSSWMEFSSQEVHSSIVHTPGHGCLPTAEMPSVAMIHFWYLISFSPSETHLSREAVVHS